MKKTVKGLIVAASVAAVVGVGAVSYAAWSAGSAATANVVAATGSIVTVGELTAESNIHGEGALKLVPYDQTAQFDGDTMTKMAKITLSYDGDSTATIAYKIVLTANAAGLKLKYQVGGATAPATADITTGWEAVPTTATAITIDPENQYVYVILDSDDTTRDNDMGQSFTIQFSAEVTG